MTARARENVTLASGALAGALATDRYATRERGDSRERTGKGRHSSTGHSVTGNRDAALLSSG